MSRYFRARTSAVWVFVVFLLSVTPALAQPDPSATSQPAAESGYEGKTTTRPLTGPSYFVPSKAIGARLETQPPGYVRTMDQLGVPELHWLEFGIEQRTRFERRDDEYRPYLFKVLPNNQVVTRPTLLENNDAFLMRSRAYLGIRDIADPFRFGLEFQDSRQFGSRFPDSDREADENDFIQAFGELYFKDALGPGEPLRFQGGRMTFDYVDRRLVGRERWRNTTSAFDGFRLQLGEQSSKWQFDFFAAEPVEKRLIRPDKPDDETWFYGMVGAWRGWSQYITLEPYYFILDTDGKRRTRPDREIHTLGLRGYGNIGKSGWDYDADVMFQFGEDGIQDDRAFATTEELGYTFAMPWKPRLSGVFNYASGDKSPKDNENNRFDRLFEPGHPYSELDLFDLRNNVSPGLRLQLSPTDKIRFEGMYRAHWLASDTDAWPATNRRDRSGRAGNFVGQAIETYIRWQLTKQLELEVGYAHFLPGHFTRRTGPADDSDFFYVQTTLTLDR